MKKWTPRILIWTLSLYYREDDMWFQNLYFLSERRAMRFIDKHQKEMNERNIRWGLCQEPVWLW